jgi:redox-sensitive bicupin YhaK (pirin superfamily)
MQWLNWDEAEAAATLAGKHFGIHSPQGKSNITLMLLGELRHE